jgi:hypothetical protein
MLINIKSIKFQLMKNKKIGILINNNLNNVKFKIILNKNIHMIKQISHKKKNKTIEII